MLRVKLERTGSRVEVHFKPWPAWSAFHFAFEAGSEWAAHLLIMALDRSLESECHEMRREAYNQGWHDAKAKKRKRLHFPIYFGRE